MQDHINLTIVGNHPNNEGLDITWSITDSCNYKCPYCLVKKSNNFSDVFLIHDINSITNDTDIKIRYLVLFGGEPTLHPKLDYIIDNSKHKIKLWTNLSRDVSYYCNLNLDYLVCTFHSDVTDLSKFLEKLDNLKINNEKLIIDCHIPISYDFKLEYYEEIRKYVNKCETIPIVGIDNYYKDKQFLYKNTSNYETDITVLDNTNNKNNFYSDKKNNYYELNNIKTKLVICDMNKYSIDINVDGSYRCCHFLYDRNTKLQDIISKPLVCCEHNCNICFLYIGKKYGLFYK